MSDELLGVLVQHLPQGPLVNLLAVQLVEAVGSTILFGFGFPLLSHLLLVGLVEVDDVLDAEQIVLL